VKNFVEQISIM